MRRNIGQVGEVQALKPLRSEAVNALLQEEVAQLAGQRYSRQGGQTGHDRWSSQKDSVYLADQELWI